MNEQRLIKAGLTSRRPEWLLLSAGVVTRAHVSTDDGFDYMTFTEARSCIPRLRVLHGAQRKCAERAWTTLVSDLWQLGVLPREREPVLDSSMLWRGGWGGWESGAGASGEEGAACTGRDEHLNRLKRRLASGDVAAAAEMWRIHAPGETQT